MEFYTAFNAGRPVRLSPQTRQFAWESLQGRYGDETMQVAAVSMDEVPDFPGMSEYEKYDAAIAKIAAEAPVRICEHERVSGAATLGLAIRHYVPATFHGEPLWYSVSHVTLGFERVVRNGVNAIEKDIVERLDQGEPGSLDTAGKEILTSMLNTIASLHVWHRRYLAALKDQNPAGHELLLRVPFEPARNFHEAVQSLWFIFAFTRLCGNWPGIGRIDLILGDYLRKDLAGHKLTLASAREILAGFWIKGCEWIEKDPPKEIGDAMHYQNIILGGLDEHGQEVTNEVTYLVLDVVEELAISDFPVSVRLNEHSPQKLLVRMAEVMRHGGGVLAAYNEPLVIASLEKFGYPRHDALMFANDGCWEVQIPGKTYFIYMPFDGLQILLNDTLGLNGTPAHFDSYADLYAKFLQDLDQAVEKIFVDSVRQRGQVSEGGAWTWLSGKPCSVVSMLTDGCAESARSYYGGGPRYTVASPHIGGAPDIGNSLYALRKLVFEDKKISFDDLMAILKNNWEGQEELRQFVLNQYTYFGNDHDEADSFTSRVLQDFAAIVMKRNGRYPFLFPPGSSTFGRQVEWSRLRSATPFGRKKGDILSNNTSPTPGTDTEGATAVIRSFGKCALEQQVSGAALDIKLYPATVQGENGVGVLAALLRGFLQVGGYFLQLDVVDAAILRRAQAHPEQYKTMSVRVAGWNARFVTLDREWQEMIIERTEQRI
jgi:pyruvate-formate lyase